MFAICLSSFQLDDGMPSPNTYRVHYKLHRTDISCRTGNTRSDRSLLHKEARPKPVLRSRIRAPIREAQLADMPIRGVCRSRRADSRDNLL